MGNEQSHMPGIEIDEKAIDVSDYWTQHTAYISNSSNIKDLSVFVGESFVNESFWSLQTPLERNVKNLMIYRHPCILKYVSSWQQNSKHFLAVEEVVPLSHVITELDILQICVGLHSILKALYFLHFNACTSHNNVCMSSIYVTEDGSWKLGGMEYLCKYEDLTCNYLNSIKTYRYVKAKDEREEELLQNKFRRKDFIDIYAFSVLAEDVLENKINEDLSSLTAFCEYCTNDMRLLDLSQRPTFDDIRNHTFFDQDFIKIHSFLMELPLKSDGEKSDFFQHLPEKLFNFNETLVASRLGGLLLSRLVLLNKTAQLTLLPILLAATNAVDNNSTSLFSESTFKQYLCPKLLDIFKVRDAQIRLLLLEHFPNFMCNFTKEQLQTFILPELLVGIKDTNDTLVAITLRTLAELVPLLGASTVIGGKRAKLFNDGQPAQTLSKYKKIEVINPTQPTASVEHSYITTTTVVNELPERPRPDGEEETSTDEVDGDLDNWEDWDMNDTNQKNPPVTDIDVTCTTLVDTKEMVKNKSQIIPDILKLDIKNQLNGDDDIDFFEDMKPSIETSNKFVISEIGDEQVVNKLALIVDDAHEEGWGDEEWE